MTDLDLGGNTARLDPNRMIVANSERVKVKRHLYEHIPLKNFLDGLRARLSEGRAHPVQAPPLCPRPMRRRMPPRPRRS